MRKPSHEIIRFVIYMLMTAVLYASALLAAIAILSSYFMDYKITLYTNIYGEGFLELGIACFFIFLCPWYLHNHMEFSLPCFFQRK